MFGLREKIFQRKIKEEVGIKTKNPKESISIGIAILHEILIWGIESI